MSGFIFKIGTLVLPALLKAVHPERIAAWCANWVISRIGSDRSYAAQLQLQRVAKTAQHLAELSALLSDIVADSNVTEAEATRARALIASARLELLDAWASGAKAKGAQNTLADVGVEKPYAGNGGACALGCLLPLGLAALLLAGCSSLMSDKQTNYALQAYKAYQEGPNTAEILVLEAPTNQTATISVTGIQRLCLSTPVPPRTLMPRDPTVWESLFDTAKTVAPWAFFGWAIHSGGIGSSSTVNNAAPAVAP